MGDAVNRVTISPKGMGFYIYCYSWLEGSSNMITIRYYMHLSCNFRNLIKTKCSVKLYTKFIYMNYKVIVH